MKRLITVTGVLFLWVAVAMPQTELDDTDMEDAIENEYRFDHAIDLNKIDVQVVDGIEIGRASCRERVCHRV